ncbi:MAG: ferrous iron transport protein A [Gammaproteobacteria bacterium]|nr:ferrous iron transport protein A [Gammaproteobacteria bacterium]
MTLDELTPGSRATIRRISGDGPAVQRLMALGLLEGSTIALTRRAIGGDPVEVEIMGYALSLRREDARRVEIELLA